jgi:class 3 adenylate cyclase
MDDIRAVMDAAGVERAAISGVSEGGPMAIMFAATYPERVSSLSLMGTFARILEDVDYEGITAEAGEEFAQMIEARWGTGEIIGMFIASDPGTVDAATLARYERSACTPRMAGQLMRHNIGIDVREVLPVIDVPTLVMHHTGDPIVPVARARYLADHIPGARLVELPGDVHFGPQSEAFRPIEAEFLTGERREAEPDRVLATVLFTDIVGSTERASELGDAQWRALLDRHDDIARREIAAARGRAVKSTGDGFLAVFDGPARAVRCAQAMGKAVDPLGLEIRAGLHTGECELRGDDVAGIAVHLGARIGALAGPGEVLVSSTVRDLTLGSGIEFADRGRHALKGVPGEWQVLAVVPA